MSSFCWVDQMKAEFKTAIVFGIVIVAIVIGVSSGLSVLEEQTTSQQDPQDTQTDVAILEFPKIDKLGLKKAPQLSGIADYINTSPEQLQEAMEGKVVLYDIWTYSCINCIRTLPYVTAWNEKYADDGLLIIGVHSPEFEFEKDVNNVRMAVDKHGIMYPVVLDNDKEIWKSFDNRYWPRKYLTDHEGYIRYDHIGEGAYDETEKMIQQLLEERASQLGLNVASAESLVEIEEFQHSSFRTPELYFGYKFAFGRNQLGSPEGFNPGQDVSYSIPEKLTQHNFYLEGTWKNLQGSMRLVSETGTILLPFHAKEVNIVTVNDAELEIYLDGEKLPSDYAGKDVVESSVMISEDGLYNLITSEEASSHLLQIDVKNTGFEIYTFTFG